MSGLEDRDRDAGGDSSAVDDRSSSGGGRPRAAREVSPPDRSGREPVRRSAEKPKPSGPEVGEGRDSSLAATSNASLGALTVLLGCLVVLLSQFVTGYTLVDETDSVIGTATLFETHGVATTIFALLAAGALAFAITTGSRPAVIGVIGMGIAVIVVFLAIDLPDVGSTGMFNTPGAGNLDATGKASAGLWMELVGAVVVVLGGIALFRLSEDQLSAINPRTGERNPRS
jgi:hypothetical protein